MAEKNDKHMDITSRLFDENEYSSMFVHTDESIKKHQEQIKNLIDLLTKDKYKALQSERSGIHLIFDAIESKDGNKHRIALLSAIWESGADASEYIVELVRLFMEASIEEALEIFTIITNNCEDAKQESIEESIEVYKEHHSKISLETKDLALEVLDWLETKDKSFQL
jgi:hypothetical protein